eukprot:TRINITY_DN5429_c0_g1_i20.p1 TRINITY_DN5429_c0_g1~~TRINITY_DN5429_c0_g1_i20.p1  ORF type:complete len:529 (-),score=105.27 TRINITY_DN5429_c0_g1_i20:544-2130(-)
MTCEPCPKECDTCESEEVCITCAKSYYKMKDECVSAPECPDGTYPDDISRQCRGCSKVCLTCYGGSTKDCRECNFEEGYGRYNEKDECHLVNCAEQTYVHVDTASKAVVCLPCDEACAGCKGESSANCTSCGEGYAVMSSAANGTVLCKECPAGYALRENDKCKEICGDGLNMGEYECDDGNVANGDGCSAECTVEEGFACYTRANEPDKCLDIVPPKASLSVRKGTLLTVTFNEDVFVTMDEDYLKSMMQVYLKSGCELTWDFASSLKPNAKLTKFEIQTEPRCSLKASQDSFTVEFNDVSCVVDRDGNELETRVLEARTMRYVYSSASEMAYSEGLGSAFDSSSMVTLGVMVFISLFQSVSVGPFWSFVNMVQLVSYLPALDCTIPSNLEIFLTDYMNIRKVAIPTDLLPDFVMAPLNFIENFVTAPLNDRFSLAGYESLSFLFNFLDELLTWFLVALLYVALIVLCRLVPKSKYSRPDPRFKYFHEWKSGYEYNGVLRILIEAYLNMNFCAMINVNKVFGLCLLE